MPMVLRTLGRSQYIRDLKSSYVSKEEMGAWGKGIPHLPPMGMYAHKHNIAQYVPVPVIFSRQHSV